MSDGGAGVLVKLLEIPVLREITLVVLWYWSLRYGLQSGHWELFGLACLLGVVVGAVYWFLYNRNRKDTGGGATLLVVLALMFLLLPLLFIAARRRKALARGAHA